MLCSSQLRQRLDLDVVVGDCLVADFWFSSVLEFLVPVKVIILSFQAFSWFLDQISFFLFFLKTISVTDN